jgi:glycosyltransferase involved in cell wall biosynthesis
MSVAATVIVPTHDHGPTLRLSVGSALAQTIEDIEVLVIGDGVPDVTREIVGELSRNDERLRFFDHPKGLRHGELYRHEALAQARGEIVCYLSDDDLWFPEHVATRWIGLRRRPRGARDADGRASDLAVRSESALVSRAYARRRRELRSAFVRRAHPGRVPPSTRGLEPGPPFLGDGPVHVAQGAELARSSCGEHDTADGRSPSQHTPARLDS